MDARSRNFAQRIIGELSARRQTLCVCESLTAGMLGATIAEVPGSSAVFRGGLITYATDLKHTLAHVPRDYLATHGPVDPGTAVHMAVGTARVCSADWALALTGVAGPDSQDGHPVGEVWVGLRRPDLSVEVRAVAELVDDQFCANGLVLGDRPCIRQLSVIAALRLLEWELGIRDKCGAAE
ncbi:MAG: CinA family protein [Corynebacterium sp.]|uniref:CinA family protein n=1 Tax=Corynebacterium sp. TaxID=1720 RepID=UPI0026DDBABA|nr:CinA family protein [Corynebacterium sp.]MDO4760759.1 CinA family protein [Corynebacterium sp.]